MVRDFELVDNDYFRIPLVKPSRKIKFKDISFKNILSRWNNFRLNRLKKKLAAKKENLVEMEFQGSKLVPGKQRERVEKSVLRKTQAIARLESKINFLENGEYYSQEFVDSRAIKLKTLMMNNLIYNSGSLYSVNEKAAEEIMSDNSVDGIIDAETAKISARVKEILAEKEAARKAAASQPSVAEEIQQPVQTELPKNNDVSEPIYTNDNIPMSETKEVIDGQMDQMDVTPTVSNDEVAAAIDSEMQKIKVSGNESSPAKVNKFINEDGTYRLRREDIDEDFRITRFDRSKLPVAETPIETAAEPDIPPFNTTAAKRKTPDVDTPKKAITEIVERKAHKFPEIILPTIKETFGMEDNQDTQSDREVPVVVPEREPVRVKVKKVTKPVEVDATEEQSGLGDINALMARVNLLKAEKQTIETMSEEANQKATSVDSAHKEMMRRLQEYANTLEDDCNAAYQSMSEVEKEAATKEAQINAMIEIMASGNGFASEERKVGIAK